MTFTDEDAARLERLLAIAAEAGPLECRDENGSAHATERGKAVYSLPTEAAAALPALLSSWRRMREALETLRSIAGGDSHPCKCGHPRCAQCVAREALAGEGRAE